MLASYRLLIRRNSKTELSRVNESPSLLLRQNPAPFHKGPLENASLVASLVKGRGTALARWRDSQEKTSLAGFLSLYAAFEGTPG